MSTSLRSVQDFLRELPPGSIDKPSDLSTRLAAAWDSLTGSDDGGMLADKLINRMESVEWDPPRLEFTIERHGATVNGSTRAELQTWAVDVEVGTAALLHCRVRQVGPARARLDVAPLVDLVARAIVAGADDPRLKWSADRTSVRVQIGEVIPDRGPKQTAASRRKRFRDALDQRLNAAGWETLKPNFYSRQT